MERVQNGQNCFNQSDYTQYPRHPCTCTLLVMIQSDSEPPVSNIQLQAVQCKKKLLNREVCPASYSKSNNFENG